jgi:hypothetical protein
MITRRDAATGGTMQACSRSGPVGPRIVLEGHGCATGGPDAAIVYATSYSDDGLAGGTVGWVQLPPIALAADGSFRVEVVIPAQLGSRQGAGGGPTTPGRYKFFSKPPVCSVPFTVTGT